MRIFLTASDDKWLTLKWLQQSSSPRHGDLKGGVERAFLLLIFAIVAVCFPLQAQASNPYTEGKKLYRTKEYDQALIKFQEAQALAQQKGDQRQEARVLLWLGRSLEELKRYDDALRSLNRSFELFRQLNVDRKWVGEVLEEIGDVYERLGDDEKALEYFRQAVAVYQTGNEREDQQDMERAQGKIKRIEEKSWWNWWNEHHWWDEHPVVMLLLTLLGVFIGVLIVGTTIGTIYLTILRKAGFTTIVVVQEKWKEFEAELGLTFHYSPWKHTDRVELQGTYNGFPVLLYTTSIGSVTKTGAEIQLGKLIRFRLEIWEKRRFLSKISPGIKTGDPELDHRFNIQIKYRGVNRKAVGKNILGRLILDPAFKKNVLALVSKAKVWEISTRFYNQIIYNEIGWITDKQRLRQILELLTALALKVNALEIK